jgi:hypothetical protein
MRVARWYCPEAHKSFSLLPDCLSSRLCGSLDEAERAVALSESMGVEAAAQALRGEEFELPGALRWLRRRRRGVRAAVLALVTAMPGRLGTVPEVKALRSVLGTARALVALREIGAAYARRLRQFAAGRKPVSRRSSLKTGLTPDQWASSPPAARGGAKRRQPMLTTDSGQSPCFGTADRRPGAREEKARGLYPLLREKAERVYEIPGSRRSRVAAETIRDWLAEYRRGGFDALRPQVRRDQGRTRAIPQEVADVLCQLKDETPTLSVAAVIEQAKLTGGVGEEMHLAPATVHRLLSPELMNKGKGTDQRSAPLCFDNAGERG